MKKWKVLNREVLVKNEWLTLTRDTCATEDGMTIPDYYWVEGNDYVIVIGTTSNGEIVLTEQYRHGVKEILQEFPGGIIEKEETPIDTAKRELYEETGYIAQELFLKKEMYSAPASLSTKGYLFFARDLKGTGIQHLDPSENIDVKLIDFDNLQQMIDQDIINSAFGVAAAYMAIQNRDWFLKS